MGYETLIVGSVTTICIEPQGVTDADSGTCPPSTISSINGCPADTIIADISAFQGTPQLAIGLPSIASVGSKGVSEKLNYLPGSPSKGATAPGFSLTTDVGLDLLDDGGVQLTLANMVQRFAAPVAGVYPASGNNTAAVLTRSGEGTPADQFSLLSRDGSVTRFFGFDPSIDTPGRPISFTDRWGNTQSYIWTVMGASTVVLSSVTDSYGRTVDYTYSSTDPYQLIEITDFIGRSTLFQYDSDGRLVAIVLPAVTRGASSNSNIYPGGTAYAFLYDTSNSRPERQNDLIAVYYPNQTLPYLDTSSRVLDVDSVYASATPRVQFEFYQDPTDTDQYGKVQYSISEDASSGAGGTTSFVYMTTGLPTNLIDYSDPIVSQVLVTDPNGNQVTYAFNAGQMVVQKVAYATRGKNSLEASSWTTWTAYNSHNQPTEIVMPEGNTIQYDYEDETNTISFGGVPYARRIGLLKTISRFPGNSIGVPSRSGSGPAGQVQTRLIKRYFYDPLFNHVCASIEERGNEIATGQYFIPQNGGTTPTNSDRSRYATITTFDYQKDSASVVQGDAVLQAQLGLTSTQIGQLISYVNSQMTSTSGSGGLPGGFAMQLGDVNGEGTGYGTSYAARHQGCIVQVTPPGVRQLVPSTGSTPWAWTTQNRPELYTSNARGQFTTYTNAEGNLTVYVRYPENNPDGDGDAYDPSLSTQQYGRIKETHVDADPSTVMTLVGSYGDMITFVGGSGKISRTNTPGSYLNLVTSHQGTTGCTSCNYDPMGNVLTSVDARGNKTTYNRNELGRVYNVTGPAPYAYQVETSYDANGNVIQVDTQDVVVAYTSSDPTSPSYAQFLPSGSGTTANVPTTTGQGGVTRSGGWYSNLYSYDLLDNKIEEDIDASYAGSSSPVGVSLVTTYKYDSNQNLIKITKPQGNIVEYDYDERDMRIATRVGYVAGTQPGAITITAYDGNGNVIEVVGSVARGTSSQKVTVTIGDAFRSGSTLSYTGDLSVLNTYDGFDRLIYASDAVGGMSLNTFDPGGRAIATLTQGTPGGATPTDRTGSANVNLSNGAVCFDEAGRAYDRQQFVYLNTGGTLTSPTHALASGRSANFSGGGLAFNNVNNSNTATVTLTTGGSGYVMSRSVYDRLGRTTITANDNTAQTSYTYDGANRQLTTTDPLGNVVTNVYDANGNVTSSTRTEKCTISSSIAAESFNSIMLYDVLNRVVVSASQGADGATPVWNPSSPNSAILNLIGYDSRNNRTNTIDPKANTVITTFDGAGRQLKSKQHLRTGGVGTNAIASTVTTSNSYDSNSRLTTLTDSNGGTTNWTYDTLDRQLTMVFYDGSTRSYGYALDQSLTGYTDENGSVFAHTYDVLARRTATSITLATNAGGTTAQSFKYDGLGRKTFARDSISSTNADASFTFDSLSRVVEEVQTYGGNTRYVTHDKFTGNTATDLMYPNNRQVSSGYDALYRRNSIAEVSGSTNIASWQFFGGRTATVTLGNGMVTSYMNTAQTRSAIQYGQTTPGWGDITTDHLGYDGAGRLIAKRHFNASSGVLVGNTTSYDPSSNKLFERALHAESRSSLYDAYDSMDRLLDYQRGILNSSGGSIDTPISLPGTNQQQTYNLDALGNWSSTEITLEGATDGFLQNRTHNKLNQITAFGLYPGSTSVFYDQGNNSGTPPQKGNGNIINDGTRVYKYDALNRLIQVNVVGTGTPLWANYTYDASGRRIRKVVSNGGITGTSSLNGTTDYLYDGQQIIEDRNSSNVAVAQYVWGQYIDEQIQQKLPAVSGSPVFYLLSDLLYRSVALTNSSGAIVEAYDTDAYGNTICYSAAGTGGNWFADNATTTNAPQNTTIFTGRQYDPETLLYNYRARYYNPLLGRFISRDPIGYFGGINLFSIVENNTLRQTDPFGYSQWVGGPTRQLVSFTGISCEIQNDYDHFVVQTGDDGNCGIYPYVISSFACFAEYTLTNQEYVSMSTGGSPPSTVVGTGLGVVGIGLGLAGLFTPPGWITIIVTGVGIITTVGGIGWGTSPGTAPVPLPGGPGAWITTGKDYSSQLLFEIEYSEGWSNEIAYGSYKSCGPCANNMEGQEVDWNTYNRLTEPHGPFGEQ